MKQLLLPTGPPVVPGELGRVLMIGHSRHPWPDFLALLQRHAVARLIDVRSFAQSRFCPQFNAKRMQAALAPERIRYIHAPKLGGRDPLSANDMRPHIDLLFPLLEETCLMCSEANHLDCHRHYLLTPLFLEVGLDVDQILPTGELLADTGPTPKTLKRMAAYLPK